jgi:hypothetical protein
VKKYKSKAGWMDTGALVFLVALPGAIASIAAWTNGLRAAIYWTLAGLIALGWAIVAFAPISHGFTSADLVNWVFLCVLPVTTVFVVARSHRLREHRLVAFCVAVLSYLIALVAGINIGMAFGVLKE